MALPPAAERGVQRVGVQLAQHAAEGAFAGHQEPAGPRVTAGAEAGQLVLAYKVYRCWVSEYQALPELDANATAVAIESIKLENEGWERDYSVTEPTEPTSTEQEA